MSRNINLIDRQLPIVSIIIPVYNTADYLENCLNSFLAQTYNNLEIICINDGSTDNSLSLLNHYASIDDRIVIIDQENKGVSVARNSGLDISKGEYIAFIDSDDWVDLNYIEILYSIAFENNSDIVSCSFSVESEISESGLRVKDSNKIVKSVDFIDFYKTRKGYPWGTLIKKEIIKDLRFRADVKKFEDELFWFELASRSGSNNYGISVCNLDLYHYFFRRNSAVQRNMLLFNELNILFNNCCDILENSKTDAGKILCSSMCMGRCIYYRQRNKVETKDNEQRQRIKILLNRYGNKVLPYYMKCNLLSLKDRIRIALFFKIPLFYEYKNKKSSNNQNNTVRETSKKLFSFLQLCL